LQIWAVHLSQLGSSAAPCEHVSCEQPCPSHVPFVHFWLQQSVGCLHAVPLPPHAGPPQTPLLQALLQHWSGMLHG
jgi:hypothetical protein